jgi:hypothetical protein
MLLSACTSSNDWGGFHNPFVQEHPFIATPVPADFAIVVDESHLTYVNRQHIQQVITAADSTSRTTYTSYRDPGDTISEHFPQETKLTPSQIQAMWNEVSQSNLMNGASVWVNWLSGADLYQENTYIVQIRSNNRTRTYRQTNGFPGSVRPLMLLVNAVRLPLSRNAQTPVVGEPSSMPASAPASMPSTAPVSPGM